MSKILICDDSWLTRRGVKRIVQSEGYEVCEAENGLQGLEMLRASDGDIDAVILDLLMPKMSGVEFLDALKGENIMIPVVVLTADIQKTVKEKCTELGASAFLNKPPEPEVLIAVLNDLLTGQG